MKLLLRIFILVLLVSNSFAQDTSGLIAYLPFDGFIGQKGQSAMLDTTSDVTGNGHYGYVNGAFKVADRFGRPNFAYGFNGMSSIEVNNPDSFFINEFTVTYWVKPNQITPLDEYHYTISMGSAGGDNSMSINNNSYKGFVAGAYNLTAPISIAGANQQIVPGTWYYVAFVRSRKQLKLYVNGTLTAQDTILYNSLPNYGVGIRKVTIGVRCTYNTESYINASIDEVKFYGKALSSNHIENDYLTGVPNATIANDFEIYPNPNQGIVNLEYVNSSIDSYKIFDPTGRVMQQANLNNSKTIAFDGDLVNGVYLFEFSNSDGKVITKRIVLAR